MPGFRAATGVAKRADPAPARTAVADGVGALVALAGLILAVGVRLRRWSAPGPTPGAAREGPQLLDPFDRRATGAAEKPRGIQAKLAAIGERRGWRWLGRSIEVQQRVKELRGSSLAAAVALRAFVSLFPLLLLATAIAGFFAGRGDDVAGNVIGHLGLTGSGATAVSDAIATASRSARASSIVGIAGLVWTSLGLVAALQFAFDQIWQVEDRGPKDRAVGMIWLAGSSLLFVGAAALLTVLQWLPGSVAVVGVVGSMAITFALWLWTSTLLPNVDIGWRNHIPGAILGTVGLEILKAVGAFYVPRAVASSSQLYGTIGVVFAILAWLVLFGRLIVYAAALDVVLYEGRVGTVTATVQVPDHDKAAGAVDRGGRADAAA